jgi:TPR repeat protein
MEEDGSGSPVEAMELALEAVERGSDHVWPAVWRVEETYDGPDKDALVIELLRMGARRGDIDALTSLGYRYDHGYNGLIENDQRAYELFEESAKLGSETAMYNMGAFYRDGVLSEVNEKLAAEWFLRAAQRGEVEAARELGLLLANGTTSIKDLTPLALLEHAAIAGDAAAQLEVAKAYEEGRLGVRPDHGAAVTWYRKAVGNTAEDHDSYREQAREALIRLGEPEVRPGGRGGSRLPSVPESEAGRRACPAPWRAPCRP